MVLRLPEQVGEENQNGECDSIPEPFAAQVTPRVGEENPGDNANRKNSHRVFRQHAETDRGSDGYPPAWIAGYEQAHHEVSGKNPAEVVEGNVLHECAAAEAERHPGERGDQLRTTASAHLFSH